MGEQTGVEWADHTFNPWEGCQKVGRGCDNCYAETRNARFAPKGSAGAPNWGPSAPRRLTSAANWRLPLKWQEIAAAFFAQYGRRQRVFCASLADVFDNAVPDMWRAELANLIDATPDLDWLLLTKRIGNAADMLEIMFDVTSVCEPRPNVWIGATVVNQAEADRDIPKLMHTRAAKHFLSMEPLLGPVDLRAIDLRGWTGAPEPEPDEPDWRFCALSGGHWFAGDDGFTYGGDGPQLGTLDLVIVGGENATAARPMHPSWVRSLRDQCADAGVSFFFKQWGTWAPISEISEQLLDTLYVPAPATRPDASRRCKVAQLVMQASGRIFPLDKWSRIHGDDPASSDFAYLAGTGAMIMMAIGKHRAGRTLNGVEHNGQSTDCSAADAHLFAKAKG